MKLAEIKKILLRKNSPFYALLALPLWVYAMPDFASTLEEDLLLLALFVYVMLRALNDERLSLDSTWKTIVAFSCLACVYGIGWLGLARGYGDAWERWIAIYPICLAAAVFVRPEPIHAESTFYRVTLFTLGSLALALFVVVVVCFSLNYPNPLLFDLPEASLVIPALVVVPVWGCLALVSRSMFRLDRGRDHLGLFFIVMVAAFSVWRGNITTWAIWYQAGEFERAWTPHKYDASEDIAEAERKPFQAAAAYLRVHQRLLNKGDIPRYLNWPFFMQYRMAYQAMRKADLAACLKFLPPSGVKQPDKYDLLQKLYHTDFLLAAQSGEPDPDRFNHYWIDIEIDPDTSIPYALDIWGRVFRFQYNRFWKAWKPDARLYGAVDLELLGTTFIVLFEDGRILTSESTPLIPKDTIVQPPAGSAVDMEILPSHETLLVMTSHGEVIALGPMPDDFPDWKKLSFNRPVVADMEFDPDGKGYYLLDIYGAVHSNHTGDAPTFAYSSPLVPKDILPYWAGQNVAIDLELDPLKRGLYIYNRYGEVYTIAPEPYRQTYRPAKPYQYRGVDLNVDKAGRMTVFESNGNLIELPADEILSATPDINNS